MADKKIEVKVDFVPPCYRKALLDNGFTNPDGMPGIPDWTVKSHIAHMDSSRYREISPQYLLPWHLSVNGHGRDQGSDMGDNGVQCECETIAS